MPRGVTQYRKKWESDHDPNGMLYGKWCKKYDEKNAWCDFCKKKLLEWMEWENVLLNSMQTIRTIKQN